MAKKRTTPFTVEDETLFLRGVRVTIPRQRPTAIFRSTAPLRIKYGIDPTRPDLHWGYLAVLRKLKMLQGHGHTIVLLFGDFTARFGDPTDQLKARRMREKKEVRGVLRAYAEQVSRVLDAKKTEFRYNSEWYERMTAEELLRLVSGFTVQQLLERDMFARRQRESLPIGLHEPLYPVLQGYDSVILKADATVIGQDQLFNEIVGRHLQERARQRPQVIFGVDLLVGTDGKAKMSQSVGNDITLNQDPDEQFGRMMAVPDGAVVQYAELLTDFSLDEVRQAAAHGGLAARDIKLRVAHDIVRQLFGKEAAERAEKNFIRRFRQRLLPERMPEHKIAGSQDVMTLLILLKLAPSRAQARRLVLQRGVQVDGIVVPDPFAKITSDRSHVLSVGKRIAVKLVPRK